MILTVLNTLLEPIAIIDSYESLIWTDRYYAYGDFELYRAVNESILEIVKQDYYLKNDKSDCVMIVEKLLINSDVENGDHLTVTGKSLESILNRRIIWGQKTISGNLQNAIKELLDDCIISPSDVNRKIDNFIFEFSDDPAITELTIKAQYTGDNLYDVVSNICSERGIGFKIRLNDDNQFVFRLYSGVDRSYNQTVNPWVIFSPNFDNIINSNYVESRSSMKNVALIGGEGSGYARKYTSIGNDVGLSRREMFVDARDISSDIGVETTLTYEEYAAQLRQRGHEKLSENVDITSFEGQIETSLMFKYGEDFFNGDIIQIANEYGHETSARIVEMVMSEDETGSSVYPTLKTIDGEILNDGGGGTTGDGTTPDDNPSSNNPSYVSANAAIIHQFDDGVWMGNNAPYGESGIFVPKEGYFGLFKYFDSQKTYLVYNTNMEPIYTGDVIARFG